MASRQQDHIQQITKRCLIAPNKNLVSRNELREIENIGARDVDVLIANFLLQVRDFLFLICVQRTIRMKILVLRVINSSRSRRCFVLGYMHSLFVSKGLTLLKWRILRTCKQYENISKKCNLCLSEKFCKKNYVALTNAKNWQADATTRTDFY